MLHRLWLIFAQTATVCVAVLFVVTTFKPEWLPAETAPAGTAPAGTAPVPVTEAPQAPLGARHAESFHDAVGRAMPAVVNIFTSKEVREQRAPFQSDPLFRRFFGDQFGGEAQRASSLGSGVIVSPAGYILTNHHVVDAADEIEVALSDGKKLLAQVVGIDPETDLAVLRVDAQGLPAISFGRSEALRVGDPVLAIGNPFGVGQTVTSGINTAIYSRSGGSMGIGFAIPVSTAKAVLDQIVKSGTVTRGWIGVEVQAITPALAESFKLGDARGAIIAGVLRGGPADRAGVKPGDVLTAINGAPVSDPQVMLNLVAALQPGTRARMQLRRQAERLDVEVTVGRRPKPQPRE